MNIINTSTSPAQSPEMKTDGSTLSRVPFIIITGLLFLIPLFFLPAALPFGLHKSILLVIAVVVSLILWIIQQVRSGSLSVLPPLVLGAALALPVVYIIAAFFSPVRFVSFLGLGFEVDTATMIGLLTLLMLLTVSYFKAADRQLWAYLAFLGSFTLLGLFHLIRLLARGPVLSFNIFTNSVSNTVGSWTELGIFFGVSALLAFLTLELLELSRRYRIIAYIVFYVSLFFMAVINSRDMWYVFGIIALIVFAYGNSFSIKNITRRQDAMPEEMNDATRTPKRFSSLALIVVIISFFLILANGPIKDLTASFFHIDALEVRSSWSGTADIAKQVLFSKRAAVGVGPNRFAEEWTLYRPQAILGTQFWNIELNSAVGFVPTSIITTGWLGLLAWILFFAVFVHYGSKALLLKSINSVGRYLLASSFFVSLYLWIYAVIYSPTLALLALTFISTGLFIAACIRERIITPISINLAARPRSGFIFSILLILLMMATIAGAYGFIKVVASEVYYQKAAAAANSTANLDDVELNLGKAITLSPQDLYYRLLVSVDAARIGQVVNSKDVSQDTLKNQFNSLYAIATQNAGLMIQRDPTDYQNWLTLASLYADLTGYGVQGAYENAVATLAEVDKRNPHNPALSLLRARLELAHRDAAKAKEAIGQALTLKPNYTEAIFLLSQIQVAEGNLKDAITSVEAATVINPNDYYAFFNLGLLRYNDKNYGGAANAFEQAIRLNPDYANAKYFLGVSYAKINRANDGVKLFEDLKATNPGNEEVTLILDNLKAGRDPFTGAKPPIDAQPEKRAELPVEEKSDNKAATTTTKAVTE